MINSFVLYAIDSVTGLSLAGLAVASLLKKGYKNPINQYFAGFSFTMALFLACKEIGAYPFFAALNLTAVTFSSSFAGLIFLLLFVTNLVGSHRFNTFIKWASWPLWTICILGLTPFVTQGIVVHNNDYAVYGVIYGPLIWLYIFGMVYMLILMSFNVIFGLFSTTGVRKRQLAATGIGIALSIPAVILLSLILPIVLNDYSISGFGTMPILILVGCTYYGAIRYQLFDIRSTIVRTLTYVMSTVTLIGIYYLVIAAISLVFLKDTSIMNQSPISTALIVVLLLMFQPTKNFFDKLTGSVFYRGYYSSDDLFARLNQIYSDNTTEMSTLLEKTATEIAKTLKGEQALLFINTGEAKYLTGGTIDHSPLSEENFLKLQAAFATSSQTIVCSTLEEDNPIRDLMLKCKIELIVPLIQTKVIGFLCLGEHRSSHYTSRDVKVLNTIAGGLVIAIKNAMSIQEIKDINAANLQQRIASATKELSANNAMLRKIDGEKDEFVSVTSHELRTPMTVLSGFINLLQRQQIGPLNEQQQDILTKMASNTKSLINLTNDMLDLSKMEANKSAMDIADVSIKELMGEVLDKTKILYDEKAISLTYEGTDAIIKTDKAKFERIMTNLLGNANKFTDHGGSVKISSTVDYTTHLATICVADNGIGIPPESISSLFKKFSQVDNHLKRQYGGTGLGLAICKEMVEKMGGTIWATSVHGQGSQFHFTMPLGGEADNNTVS